ncbi:hypothetical protein B0H16DRAFT_1722517 [Mycena metata]|uniref:Uncharacterized protein n=1 Tax=Mycena metata TaxID=1033252 RepID=A0AAD7NCD0_9AGAR|nr:hypothetical protein B0H16DRAFT_1722517 [Mycena metata]
MAYGETKGMQALIAYMATPEFKSRQWRYLSIHTTDIACQCRFQQPGITDGEAVERAWANQNPHYQQPMPMPTASRLTVTPFKAKL